MANSRITYNNINVDLERVVQKFSPQSIINKNESVSQSGISQTAIFYTQDFIDIARNNLTGQEIEELREFVEYAKDGSTFQFEYDKDLGAYISFEGKSLKTNDEVAGTFTRTNVNDSAYYYDPSTGLLTAVDVANTGRFPAGKYGRGILLEGARTNLITSPSDLTTTWTAVTGGLTINANTTEVKDPLGTNIADKIELPGLGQAQRFDTSTVISTNDGVISCLAKSAMAGNAELILQLKDTAGALLSSTTHTVKTFDSSNNWGNGFQLFQTFYDNPGTNANNWRVEISPNALNEQMYVLGFNLEVGADVKFASSPIGVTSTSSITRNGENNKYLVADIVNRDKGTVMFWFKPQWTAGTHNAGQFLFFIESTNSATRHLSYFITSAGNHECRLYDSEGGNSSIGGSAATHWVQNTWAHCAITYDSMLQDDTARIRLYINGAEVGNNGATALSAPELDNEFYVGSNSTTSQAFGVYDDVKIRKNVLSAGEISNIYNQGRGIGARRNRWPSLIYVDNGFAPIWQHGNRFNLNMRFKEALT